MANTVWRNDSTDGTIRVKLPDPPDHVLVVASDGELFITLPINRAYLVDTDLGAEIINLIDTAFAKIYEARQT